MERYISTPKELRSKTIAQKEFERTTNRVILKFVLLLLCSFFLLAFATANAQTPGKHFNNLNSDGVILDGYDAVAFFTDNKPVKGYTQFQYKYEDATYYFASQDHLDLFKTNPDKYKPQFGGWCAYAVSLGRVAPIDVNTFSIVNDRLVIQHNQRAVNGWNKDVQGNLSKADKYWPKVSAENGKQIKTDEEKAFLNNTDPNGVTLQGYDAVAYFTINAALKGDPKYFAHYNGATYWFASEANATMFKDRPEMFAPQYGSFCGYAMCLGKLRPIDPTVFQIYNGRLILQHTKDAYDQFNKSLGNNVAKADTNWPEQIKKHAGKKVKFDKPAKPAPENTTAATN
jgi:YHS domain-containing protein